MPRKKTTPALPATPAPAGPAPGKLDVLTALLSRQQGTTVDEMTQATGWQAHSVRGAMAGALKKRGLTIASDKVGGVRTYLAASTRQARHE